MAKTLGETMGRLFKSYLFTVVAKDLKKLADIDFQKQWRKARRAVRGVELDRTYWLHKAGLTPWRPVRSTVGTGLMFVLGAAIGTVAGMALAPTSGDEFRKKLKAKAGPIFREEIGQTQPPAQA
ncbi:MAG: YtxH domain-containing protein [Myxococcaceae bacterium]|nr:YtxH domain-containing protein [Myxococcaceae bacterium]